MIKIGKLYLLQTDYSDYQEYNGRIIKVERQLTLQECDEECQSMYLCTLLSDNDKKEKIQLHVYPDELYDLNTLSPIY